MGYLRNTSFLSYSVVVFFIISIYINNVYALHGVFNLKMKSEHPPEMERQISHRMLTAGSAAPIDFHMGGNSMGIYFVEVAIGTPAQNMLLQIDTGSEVSWMNCQNCVGCTMDDDEQGIHLKPFNPEASSTSEIVQHDDLFCPIPDQPCIFNMTYFDGTGVSGYYVNDYLTYNKVTSDERTEPAKAKFIFGCTTKQQSDTSGNFLYSGVVGILGLGTHGSMVLNQMKHSNSARNVFSICVDMQKGGGIFAVGKLVKPTMPMMSYIIGSTYALPIQSIMLGGLKIEVNKSAIASLDTGSSVAFIPSSVQTAVADLIGSLFSVVPELIGARHCFIFLGKDVSVKLFDEVLPTWSFKFSDTMSLSVPPRNYFGENDATLGRWCIRTAKHDFDGLFILGIPFLSDKLITYDNENRSVGIMEYDCSSSVVVEGDDTSLEVDSHAPPPLSS